MDKRHCGRCEHRHTLYSAAIHDRQRGVRVQPLAVKIHLLAKDRGTDYPCVAALQKKTQSEKARFPPHAPPKTPILSQDNGSKVFHSLERVIVC